MKLMNKKILTILLFSLLIPGQIFAICDIGPLVPCGTSETPTCGFCHIFVLINNILSFVLTCAVPIVGAIMLVLGGFMFLLAAESPDKVENAKKIIKAVVIGIVIIFVAWVFLNSFLTSIGVSEWTGLNEGWWNIQCD